MRRTATALALALTLTACGTDEPDSAAPEPQSSAGGRAFPVTVEHRYGETVVESEPTRVVSVGYTEQDTLLQLGVVPVGVTEWYGDQPSATWPWAQDLLGDAEPVVLDQSDGIEFEKVAALEPDLIVGTNAGLSKKDYELLSQIAPTVTSVEGSTRYFSSWRDQTMQIAAALGRPADGQALVDRVDAAYADAAAAHPEWAGKSATFSQGGPYDGELYVYPDGLSTDFLTDLGFVIDPGLAEYAPEEGSQAQISAENVDLVEADVVVWATEDQEMFDELQAFSTVGRLPAVTENRSVYTDATLAGAIYFDTPLAHLYLIENLVPMIALAAEGQSPKEFPA